MGRKNKRKKTEYRTRLGFNPWKYIALAAEPVRRYRNTSRTPQRGDIWFADLEPHAGTSVQGGCRPVLIVSNDVGNTYAETLNVLPMTRRLARLAGVRFVNISEPEKKITFNAALVKRMTGNDTLNARFLHENSFDFKPNFKIFINTNYKPSVSDMTLFYSNRLKLIPFKRHFEEHEQDKGLKNFFAENHNLSAIFNWCYEGYRLFRASDLADPAAVVSATKEYQEESDRIGQFVDAWLEEGEAYEVRTSAAYKLYGEWCDKYGYRKENSTNFNNAIQRFFPIQRKRPNGESGGPTTMLIGCRFLEKENGEPEEETPVFS